MIISILFSLPFDTARLWVSPPAMPGAGFLSASPAGLSRLESMSLYAEAGWQDGFVPGPTGIGFRIPGAGTIWLEAGRSFLYSSEKKHAIRDDTSDVDTITQRTSVSFYSARMAFCQSRGLLSWGAEALAALGDLSDEFSSATGTIFPDDITVSSSPIAVGGGAGVLLDLGLVSAGIHGKYWPGFLQGKRSFQGDSLNSFVLRETVIPDSLTESFPLELGVDMAFIPLGLSGELLYRGQVGGLLAYERDFGADVAQRGGWGLTARLAGGYMGDPLFLGDMRMSFGKLGLGLRGGYWGGLRAGGFVIYTIR